MSDHPSPQVQIEIRDTLFGDLPITRWLGGLNSEATEPWMYFRRAKESLDAGDALAASQLLRRILEMQNLESRHYLEAWHILRSLGEFPTQEEGKQLLGVIVEVGMPKGLDLVAAYADHSARYYNHSGAGVVWERPTDQLDATIDELLRAGKNVLAAIGPWREPKPPAPPSGQARVNLLSPAGLHFGQGPMDQIARDRFGGPVFGAAFKLMQELTKLTKRQRLI